MKHAFPLGRALFAAAVILGMSAALKWAAPDYLSPEWALRLSGALLGLVVVVYANVIPKSLTSRPACAARPRRSRRRAASPAGAWYWAVSARLGHAARAAGRHAPGRRRHPRRGAGGGPGALPAHRQSCRLRSRHVRHADGLKVDCAARDLHARLKDKRALIIDLNAPHSWLKARVPGALNLAPRTSMRPRCLLERGHAACVLLLQSLCAARRRTRRGARKSSAIPMCA